MTGQRVGHFKVARKLFGSDDLFYEANRPRTKWEAWLDLLQMAAWRDGTVYNTTHGTDTLNRGEFVVSLRYIGARWKWDKMKVSRYFSACEKAGRTTRQREGVHGIIYLIVNYTTYQRGRVRDETANETAGETGTRQRRDKEEEVKEVRSTRATTYSPAAGAAGGEAVGDDPAPWDASAAPPPVAALAGTTIEPPPKRGRAKPSTAPKYPHYTTDARTLLYEAWKERRGSFDYARFVKETAGMFDRDPPQFTPEEVLDALKVCLAFYKHEAKTTPRSVNWNLLTPARFAGDIVRWIEDARRFRTDPDYLDVLCPPSAGRSS